MYHDHDYLLDDKIIDKNKKKTQIVIVMTLVTMVVEIATGYLTGSMALLADGWHMATHAGALTISLIAYKLALSKKLASMFSFGTGKIIPLGGYTNAILLTIAAAIMAFESFERLLSPVPINFQEAIFVAIIGLLVNVISALILSSSGDHHHHGHDHEHSTGHHHHHDHNIKGAYLHVLADALTSITAIIALVVGMQYQMVWLDPAMGVLGSIIILRWAYTLCKDTAKELLDQHCHVVDHKDIERLISEAGAKVIDLHSWKIAPQAVACEIVLLSDTFRGVDYYKEIVNSDNRFAHLILEERISQS